MEAIEQTLNGSYSAGGSQTVTVSRNGDLVSRMWVQMVTASSDLNQVNPGYSQFDSVELEIGGQRIDKQTGHFMNTWSELTQPNSYGQVGASNTAPVNTATAATHTLFQKMALAGGMSDSNDIATDGHHFVPLQFWFCKNPGLALPLIALQYHEVKVKLNYVSTTWTNRPTTTFWVDYIYLDTDERRRFAQQSHEYLIEQVQHQTESTGGNIELNFNHPVKELIFTGELTLATGPAALSGTYQLKLNGHDRFAVRDALYFTRCQVWSHHTGYGGVTTADSIGVYSFALKPEEHQPSGTCNFSRIDNARLVQGTSAACEVFAINYNVLRIMSGMGGLAYSN